MTDLLISPRFHGFLLALTLLVSFASSGSAQAPGPRHIDLRIAPELALSLTSVAPPPTSPPPMKDADTVTELRRSRAMIAAGVGMLLSGAIGMGWGVNACDDPDDPSTNLGFLAGGAVVMGAGLAISLSGYSRLRRADRSRSDWSKTLPLLALGTALTSAALWFGAGTPEWVECVSS